LLTSDLAIVGAGSCPRAGRRDRGARVYSRLVLVHKNSVAPRGVHRHRGAA
jgi:hypothetical protein